MFFSEFGFFGYEVVSVVSQRKREELKRESGGLQRWWSSVGFRKC